MATYNFKRMFLRFWKARFFLLVFKVGIVVVFFLYSCEKEDLQRMSFAQVETIVDRNGNDVVVVNKDLIVLEGKITDEEFEDDPVRFGHVILADGTLPDADKCLDATNILAYLDDYSSRIAEDSSLFQTVLLNPLSLNFPNFQFKIGEVINYTAFVEWSDGRCRFGKPQVITIPDITPKINSVVKIETELKVEITTLIDDAGKDFGIGNIESFELQLTNNNTNDVITFTGDNSLIQQASSGNFTLPIEFFFCDFNTPYDIQTIVTYTRGNVSGRMATSEPQAFVFESEGDFWVNAADLNVDLESLPELEGAVVYNIEDEIYFGSGRKKDGSYNQEFFRLNSDQFSFSSLNEIGALNERMLAINFTRKIGGQERAFIGGGMKIEADGDTTIYSDFYRINFSDLSNPLQGINFNGNDLNDLSEEFTGTGVSLSADLKQLLLARHSAFSFVTNSEVAYMGGGIGWTFKPKNKSILEEGDWLDFNDNGDIDWGEWVDINGDTILDVNGIRTTLADSILISGITIPLVKCNSSDITANCVNINGSRIPVNITTNGEEFINYDNNNKINGQAEWIDVGKDQMVSLGEIELQQEVKEDFWKLGNGNVWQKVDAPNQAVERFGGFTIKLKNTASSARIFLLGGAHDLENPITIESAYEFDAGDDSWTRRVISNLSGFVYGQSFVLNNIAYWGGGEDFQSGNSFSIPALRNQKLSLSPTSVTRDVSSCGLSALSKGIAIGTKDKGFMGLGRITKEELTNELWIYIPKK